MKKLLMILLVASTGMVACKSEIDNKPAATVNEPAKEEAKAEPKADEKAAAKEAPAADMKDVALVAESSSVEWVGAKVTGDHKGGFKGLTGKGKVDADGNLQAVEVEVDTTTIFSDTERLTGHLKSADFFDVEKHPKASFKSTKIVEKKSDAGTHEITGDMTIRGVTKSITFPATITTGDMINAKSEFTLMRFDFGIEYKGKPDDLIKDEVLMKLNLNFKK